MGIFITSRRLAQQQQHQSLARCCICSDDTIYQLSSLGLPVVTMLHTELMRGRATQFALSLSSPTTTTTTTLKSVWPAIGERHRHTNEAF